VNRREFVRSAATAAVGLAAWPALGRAASRATVQSPRKFHLSYAPHFGMFQQHAGPDLVAQLEFMAAEGFTALEDNNLRTRPVPVQERGSTCGWASSSRTPSTGPTPR
jgi:hydroxypyruvate isomerase